MPSENTDPWLQVCELLDQEIERAESGIAGKIDRPPDPPEDMMEQQRVVDAACAHFAQHRTWPRLDQGAAWELYNRLLGCREFAHFVAPKPRSRPNQPSIPNERFVRWLLVEYWAFAGFWRRLYALEGGATKDD